MATSGTVSQTVFNTRKVIDHAFRRCKIAPQQITAEYITTAQDLLYLLLSTLAIKGIALWCIEKKILPMYEGVQSIPCPLGTVDVLNANLRQINRLLGQASASEGIAENAFDGGLATACVQTLPGGYIQLELPSATTMYTFGILPGVTAPWEFEVQVSGDGLNWLPVYENLGYQAVDSEWLWFDVEGIPEAPYIRLQAGVTTVLNVREFVISNNPQEIPVAKVNRDDYANLPNKIFRGRPTEFWYDRKRLQPIMTIWPAPDSQYTFWQLTVYTQRYVQDVGTLTEEIEIPQRWYLAIINELAKELSLSIPEVDRQIIPQVQAEAASRMSEAWSGETDSSPTYILPNIRPYTA